MIVDRMFVYHFICPWLGVEILSEKGGNRKRLCRFWSRGLRQLCILVLWFEKNSCRVYLLFDRGKNKLNRGFSCINSEAWVELLLIKYKIYLQKKNHRVLLIQTCMSWIKLPDVCGKQQNLVFQINMYYEIPSTELDGGEDLEFIFHEFSSP